MSSNARAKAVVKDYDSSTATGFLDVSGRQLRFLVTSFFSDPPNRVPRSGEHVEVVFQESGGEILAVLSER